MSVTWIGDVFDVETTPIVQKVGKDNQTTGYNYFASIAGAICAGPVDAIRRIKFDDTVVWEGPVERGAETYIDLTIENRGTIRLYWGTETQTLDDELQGSGQSHSPMRGWCYFVGIRIAFGANKTTAPNIIFELTRQPVPPFLTEDQAIIATIDSNPIAILWSLWTDVRFGLGRDIAELDSSRLTSAALTLKTEGIGISPLIDSQEEFKAILAKLLEHVDGYPTTYDGLLGVELVRPVAGSITRFDKDDWTSDPDIEFQTWFDTYDQVTVKFSDYEKDGDNNNATHKELASFRITGRHKSLDVERPWITRHAVASAIASSLGRINGFPRFKGRVDLRQSVCEDIDIGSVFELECRDGSILRCRAVSRTDPASDNVEVSIEFESDRGDVNDSFYIPAADAIPDPVTYEAESPYAQRIIDSPFAFASSGLNELIFMAARADSHTTDFDVWKGNHEEGPYIAASYHREEPFHNWAVRAKLTSTLSVHGDIIDEIGISFQVLSADLTMLEGEWNYEDALQHDLLMFCESTGNEILSLFDVVKTGADTYTASVIRGLYDTRKRDHAINAEVWIALRTKVEHYPWPPAVASQRWYKFQSIFGSSTVDLGDVTAVAHTENFRVDRPIGFANISINGDLTSGIWIMADGRGIAIEWINTARARTVDGVNIGTSTTRDVTGAVIELWRWDLSAKIATIVHNGTAFTTNPTIYTIPNSDMHLVYMINSDFKVRVYSQRGALQSLDYCQADVIVVV